MEPPSPARLYATLAGGLLVVLGLVGFFSDLSWLNFLYVGVGALGLVLAACAARPYALAAGIGFTALAIWDFSADGWLHLAIGVLGLAAAAASEARAKAAAESP